VAARQTRNADGRRRALDHDSDTEGTEGTEASDGSAGGVAPLLKDLLARYAATGLPPAYLSLHQEKDGR